MISVSTALRSSHTSFGNKMKKIFAFPAFLATAGVLLAAVSACAADSTETTIKKLIEPRLGEGAKVSAVTKTPYSGLYELQIDGDVI